MFRTRTAAVVSLARTGLGTSRPAVGSAPGPYSAARSRGRAARRAVLWGAAAMLGAHLGLAAVIEFASTKTRFPEYGYRLAALRARQRERGRPLVLFLGSSCTQNAIRPDAMGLAEGQGSPLVFNFGLSGSLPPQLLLTLRRLLDDGVRPRAVVVEVFPAALTSGDATDSMYAFRGAGMTHSDVSRLEPYARSAVVRERWVRARAHPWYEARHVLVSRFAPDWVPRREWSLSGTWDELDPHGFYPFPQAGADDRRAGRLAAARDSLGRLVGDLTVTEPALSSYREVAAHGRAHRIAVAFYVVPESPVFRSWYTRRSHEELAAFVRVLTDELGAPVFEATAGLADEDFADGHHVLRAPAARYSRALADQHLKPWFNVLGIDR
ncbi:Uncharacterized protein OS=Singulisphaera acidiphila (strain ATCC BAA-1392 / DSM 18658 / VKM B-2454 / MOB10) GN=Sinac_5817 PE=4 SV=1 [Gemmataceae bacterium]|nr:Uncharacterized protein OS=Singulisphaera acidiphila (strain ATCC BAA-1392 / DSM 18658 / VKM B-2454 / MOB10) GN=Sinac_5817 PE=4 SV=1 [Gemmataceae bacterium]VTU00906.1 Uncharacterized protein OS=Singulisphaera acidiphila (strain ATCC BAA-1392 / DSM 18658 / VKM B-2454 / MOB10) GN=Sinac_5817 PE=4 SV=1 [Gemmataceae bacterium]